jgi:hypothetical protein
MNVFCALRQDSSQAVERKLQYGRVGGRWYMAQLARRGDGPWRLSWSRTWDDDELAEYLDWLGAFGLECVSTHCIGDGK